MCVCVCVGVFVLFGIKNVCVVKCIYFCVNKKRVVIREQAMTAPLCCETQREMFNVVTTVFHDEFRDSPETVLRYLLTHKKIK